MYWTEWKIKHYGTFLQNTRSHFQVWLTSPSPSPEEQVPISEYYGIGGESYGEKEFSHFLILKGQPIPLPIKLPQDGNSQARSDYLLIICNLTFR